MLKKVFQTVFAIVGGVLGYYFYTWLKGLLYRKGSDVFANLTFAQDFMVTIVFVLVFGLIFLWIAVGFDKFSGRMARRIQLSEQQMSTGEIVGTVIGLLIGIGIAFLIGNLYNLIPIAPLQVVLSTLTYLFFGYFGLVIGRNRGRDFHAPVGGFLRQRQTERKAKAGSPKILDTSVIIDGRILDIMKTGFLEGQIVIPEFVLVELQHISDSSDSLKRNRGRRGLDVLNSIQDEFGVEIYDTNGDKSLEEIPEVDVKLLKLAQRMDGKVITNDFNLNKVAGIKGVEVLNINDLANAVKPIVLPGEKMKVFLVKEGKNHGQALAYLDDGTMIVVADGKKYINQNITVDVTSVLQTSAGRMIFAKPVRQRS